ncbi:MAG: hypothetical protein AAGH68_01170 [Pseudomonadota bacterium]
MKWFNALLPEVTAKLRRMIRREIRRDIQNNLITHAAARQSFDLYEMRLETLDTRVAKRILALEARVAQLEAARAPTAQPTDRRGAMRQAG